MLQTLPVAVNARTERGLQDEVPLTIWMRLTALGFAIGAAGHIVGFGLFLAGILWYGPHYPGWRHVVMASVDMGVVWVAFRRTRWLVSALFGFFAEQIVVNGLHLIGVLVLIAALIATWEKWGRAAQA